MQNAESNFSTGDFRITIEGGPRMAFMRLDRDTTTLTPTELADLSKRLASTRRALVAAGYKVQYVDLPRPDYHGRKAG